MKDARAGEDAPATPTVLQVVDALILYDTPILDRRFQEAVDMHPDAEVRAALRALPGRVAAGSRETRRAGIEWERVAGSSFPSDEFRLRAERFLLEAFLDGAEAQIRLKTFMALHAPDRGTRALIERAIAVHRELTDALRHALTRLDPPPSAQRGETAGGASFVDAERPEGDLRGQVESALRRMRAGGTKPRALTLSANALRRLRDQGLFAGGETTLEGVPVEVDLSWDGSRYALTSFESATLEEIVRR